MYVKSFFIAVAVHHVAQDFHEAMPASKSKVFYEQFFQRVQKMYKPDKIKNGEFGIRASFFAGVAVPVSHCLCE